VPIAHRYSSISRPTSLSPRSRTATAPPHRRTFINISNLFPNNGNNNSNGNDKDNESRTLRATKTLPFPPAPLFEIISSVESYSEFLPFLAASTVTARDPVTNHPTQAFLSVGYGAFSETFTSRVNCDRSRWTVEARSGDGLGDDGNPVPGGDEGLFSHLSTRWELIPRGGNGGKDETEVKLEIRFRFQNPLHTAMMGAVEHKVAGAMIEAFERRIKEKMVFEG
jgi:coenzyme Q-binding protein COQ10